MLSDSYVDDMLSKQTAVRIKEEIDNDEDEEAITNYVDDHKEIFETNVKNECFVKVKEEILETSAVKGMYEGYYKSKVRFVHNPLEVSLQAFHGQFGAFHGEFGAYHGQFGDFGVCLGPLKSVWGL